MALLPDTDVDAGATFLERVRERVAGHPFAIGSAATIHMTISAGVATFPGIRPCDTPEMLVRLADEALYAAKDGGRDRVVRFDETRAGAAFRPS